MCLVQLLWWELIAVVSRQILITDVVAHWSRFHMHSALQPCITGRILQLGDQVMLGMKLRVANVLHCDYTAICYWPSLTDYIRVI